MQVARQWPTISPCDLDKAPHVTQAEPCLGRDLLSRRSDGDGAIGAKDVLLVEQLVHFLNRIAESGLRDETGLGRAAEMACLRQGNEVPELPDRG